MPLAATVIQFRQGENCIEALGGRPFVFATVDPYHNELQFSIPKLSDTPPKGFLPDYPNVPYPFDIWDAQGKTIVFKIEDTNNPPKWLGAYSYNPEGFATLQNQLYSFKYGHLYEHNSTQSFGNFYGIQYLSKIMFIANQIPKTVKVFNNVTIESNISPYFVYFRSENPTQQASDLNDYNFKNLEGVFYCALFRNKLTPTASGYTTNGLLTGDKMRTYALRCMIQFNATTTPTELRFVDIGYDLSRGHTTT